MNDDASRHRSRITAAFDRAARYDEAAAVQRTVAGQLAGRILATPLPRAPRVLELGCGTGFLTHALSGIDAAARWTISDIAPDMVARARAAIALDADYRVIDGEAVDPLLGRFDLIASSLAFQWFADLPGAVDRLMARLEPGGLLAFSTMAAGCFAEWSAALAAEGLASGVPAYPDEAALLALAPPGAAADVEVVSIADLQADARGFLGRLKAIGAATPVEGYRPLAPAALRGAMARFDAGPRIATYRIGFCLFRRPGG